MPPERPTSHLEIYLAELPVGTLRVEGTDYLEFTFHDAYLGMADRPTLGQYFEDDLRAPYRRRFRLPFFSNLLPEGRLRALLHATHGLRDIDDVRLLALLGEDLPGAVRAVPGGDLDHAFTQLEEAPDDLEDRLKFSLAGVQLKFSMLRQGRGWTLPTRGLGGDWIVKLPDATYDQVPENEFSMLRWARAAGIVVPDHDLVKVAALDGLPPEAADIPGRALAVKRFDRGLERRIHIEDFAQVFDHYADQKYKGVNFEQLASIVVEVTCDIEEFLSRLVFHVVIGNADAHLKNWSLLYPDGIAAKLSPAYDMVSTVQYLPKDGLALKLARSKDFGAVSVESFRRLARRVNLEGDKVEDHVRSAVTRIREAWQEVEADLPLPQSFRTRLREHQARVPLLREL